MTLQTDLAQVTTDAAKFRSIVNGAYGTMTATDSGNVPSLSTVLTTIGAGNARGAWVTATAYSLNDVVTQGGSTYRCVSVHTSGTFATDLAAGRWLDQTGGLLASPNNWTGVNTFSNTTDSGSTSTGAIVTAGGIGVAKNLNVGGTVGIGSLQMTRLAAGALKLSDSSAARYRSTFQINSSGLDVVAYDDTAGAYLPMTIEGNGIELRLQGGYIYFSNGRSQFGSTLVAQSIFAGNDIIGGNTYYNGNFVAIQTGAAALYQLSSGNHYWYNAASASAGAGQTMVQRMRLDTNGNLGIGTDPTAGNGLLQLASGTTKANGIAFGTSQFFHRVSDYHTTLEQTATGSGAFFSMYDYTNSTYRGYVGYGASLFSGGAITDFGIMSPAALKFATNNGTTALTIDTSQRVAIGAAALNRALNVYGSAYFTDASAIQTTIWPEAVTGAGGVGTNSNHPFVLLSNGIERARFDTSGNSTFSGKIKANSAAAASTLTGNTVAQVITWLQSVFQ